VGGRGASGSAGGRGHQPGALIRATEDGFVLVDCGRCVVAPACGVTSVLGEALGAFLAVLDRYTLADMLAGGRTCGDFCSSARTWQRPARSEAWPCLGRNQRPDLP
jgi:hypothetical protein